MKTNRASMTARMLAARLIAMMLVLFAMPSVTAAASPWVAQPTWSLAEDWTGTLGDLDGDGKLDVLFGQFNYTPVPLVAYQNTGTTSAPVWTAAPASWTTIDITNCNLGRYYYPALADLNGDGKLDLVLGSRLGVCIFKNTGTGNVGDPPVWSRADGSISGVADWEGAALASLALNKYYKPALADLDGDGKLDLFFGENGSGFQVFKNIGTTSVPAWSEMTAWEPLGALGKSVALVDLDGDGKIDLLTADDLNNVFAFKNVGTSTTPDWLYAPNWSLLSTGTTTSGVMAGDLNGDGRPDLMYSDPTSSTVVYTQEPAGMGTPGSASGSPPAAGGTTVTDTFDSFGCTGDWVQAVDGPNTSYIRDCGNGWTAYAEDVKNPGGSVYNSGNGPVGNQGVVILDNSVNGPSAAPSTTLGVAQIYDASTVAPRGVMWLLKSFPVTPGAAIQTVKGDFRIMPNCPSCIGQGGSFGNSEYLGMVVFDGIVTDPSGSLTSQGVPSRTDVLDASMVYQGGGCKAVTWCGWNTVDLGGTLRPTQGFITVAFKVEDGDLAQIAEMEVDNLTVSNVVNVEPAALPVGDIAQLWNQDYRASGTNVGGQSSNSAVAKAVKTDAAGNVYVVGDSYNSLNPDIVTLKYNSVGVEDSSWPSQDSGTRHYVIYDGGDSDQAADLAVDAAGNVYVTGRSYNTATNSDDYIVIKYDSNGVVQWSTRYDYDDLHRNDDPAKLAMDSGGDVYVTGSSCAGSSDCKYLTVKFSGATGGVMWRAVYDNLGASAVNTAVGLGLDSAGYVYVTGISRAASDDIVTLKYDSAGTQQRLNRYNSGNEDRAVDMVTDGNGNVYITGVTFIGGNPAMLTLKYDAAVADGGVPQWVKTYSYGYETLPSALTLDAGGNVYVSGITGDPGNFDWITVKYLNNGDVAWAQTFGNSSWDDRAAGVAVDASGNVFVVGSVTASAGNTHIALVKYDSSGVARNEISYSNLGPQDVPADIVLNVDGDGDTVPIVVGTSTEASSLDHIVTLQYEKAQPDLTVTQLTPPATAPIGGDISVSNTVLNVSDLANKIYADSGAFIVSYYLAPAATPTDLSNMLGTRSVSSLTAGESSIDNTTLTIPSGTTPGNYVLVAVADSGSAVTEANETNNQTTSVSLSVGSPDLTVSAVSTASQSMTRGNSYTVSTSAQNISVYNTPAGVSFRVGIYLSTDATITTGDILIGSRTVTDLAASSIDTADTTVTLPTSMAAGSYFLGAIVDDQNALVETNESNNSAYYHAPGNQVLLDTDTDFAPGLSESGTTDVVVNGTGAAAAVILDKDTSPSVLAWQAPSPAWTAPPSPGATYTMGEYALGDLDNDAAGTYDSIAGTDSGSSSKVFGYSNSSATTPTWTRASGWDIAAPCGSDFGANPVLADLDGDGLLDLVIGTRLHVCIYKNTGSASTPAWSRANGTVSGVGNWESGLPSATLSLLGHFYPAVGDLDGDGYPDLVIGRYSNGTVSAYKFSGIDTSTATCYAATCWTIQDGTGGSANWTAGIFTAGTSRYMNPALIDLNGDGKLDLLIGLKDGALSALQNTCSTCTSGPTWSAGPTPWAVSGLGVNRIVYPSLKDLNGDGRMDLLIGLGNVGTYKPYINVPPYQSSGSYYSAVQDAGVHGGYTTLSYNSVILTNSTLTVDVRAGDVSTPDGTWTAWLTGITNGSDISALGTNRYVQYRVNLGTTSAANGLVTPELDNIEALTDPSPGPSQAISITVGENGSGGGALSAVDLLMLGLFVLYVHGTRRRCRAGIRC